MTDFNQVKNIAYLGPQYSFSEMAVDEFMLKNNINCFTTPLTTIKQIVEYVNKNPDTIGILPVENTLDGTIRETYDCIISCQNPNIRILEEIILPVEYCLLSKTTEFYSITGLIAPPRVISKCQNFLNEELPRNYYLIESPSMIESAYSLRNYNLTYASIGNRKIAQSCMLNILKENINDDKNNRTKYIVIGDYETTQSVNDKTTVALTIGHAPGALLNILKVFAQNNINLTYISSQISKKDPNEYIFIITFDGHVEKSNIMNAISEIKPHTSFFRYLGSYKNYKN